MRTALTLVLGLVLLAALLVGCQHLRLSAGAELGPPPPAALRVASHNVHYILVNRAEGRWSRADWERRKRPLDRTFRALDADIVAFQEMESFEGGDDDSVNLARSWLLERNPGYGAAAVGDWREFPSTQPIFYRKAVLAPVDQGWFFFSETPEMIYSRTFDGSYPAFASWADLRDRETGRVVRILNVHLDHSSPGNRRKSVDLIAGRLEAWIAAEGRSVILAGDLNAWSGSALHRRLEAAGLSFVAVPGATYHFDRGLNLVPAIDHIGHSADLAPLGRATVFREKTGEVWPSDHYPVVADFAR